MHNFTDKRFWTKASILLFQIFISKHSSKVNSCLNKSNENPPIKDNWKKKTSITILKKSSHHIFVSPHLSKVLLMLVCGVFQKNYLFCGPLSSSPAFHQCCHKNEIVVFPHFSCKATMKFKIRHKAKCFLLMEKGEGKDDM